MVGQLVERDRTRLSDEDISLIIEMHYAGYGHKAIAKRMAKMKENRSINIGKSEGTVKKIIRIYLPER